MTLWRMGTKKTKVGEVANDDKIAGMHISTKKIEISLELIFLFMFYYIGLVKDHEGIKQQQMNANVADQFLASSLESLGDLDQVDHGHGG